jgi:hypothetical protein
MYFLSSDQSHAGSQFNRLLQRGFLKARQAVGIDLSESNQKANRVAHPGASWPTGNWLNELPSPGEWKVGLAHLDTTSRMGFDRLRDLVIHTMYRCPQGTVLVVNAIMNNPYCGNTKVVVDDSLVDMVYGISPYETAKWDTRVDCLEYLNGKSVMRTHVWHKRMA